MLIHFVASAPQGTALTPPFFAIAIQPHATYYPAVSELEDAFRTGTGSIPALSASFCPTGPGASGKRLPNVEASKEARRRRRRNDKARLGVSGGNAHA
jgi:hypothetical protein